MSVESVKRAADNVIVELGRAALHSIAPSDFEYYACTFELLDSRGNIEDLFNFPVMPSAMSIGRKSLVSIKKTGLSYMSQFNDSFVGRDVGISGTFGRKFRLLLRNGVDTNVNNLDSNGQFFKQFDLNVKTGYGALKLLEKLVESSQKLDASGNPKFLIFYNYVINHHHVVEVTDFQVTQSLENNMMWNWSLQMKSIANIDNIAFSGGLKKHLTELLAVSALNNSLNIIFSNITLDNLL
jgi:hypothetical protein